MINRGFIPWNGRRDQLDDIAVDSAFREVKIQVSRPIKRIELKTSDISNQFPVLIQAIDFDVIEEISSTSFVDVIGLLDPSSDDGFVRKWEPYTGSIEKHIGYAIQWFLMALVLGIIGIRIGLKQRKK
jgi:surfeit locus 1 family protein